MTKEVPRTSVLRDEELNKTLIARLRSVWRYKDLHLCPEAADRIEALIAERETCEKYRDAYDEMGRIGTQAVRDLEAKLAENEVRLGKAVEALLVVDALDPESLVGGCSRDALSGLVNRMGDKARTTLAEIKSHSDEFATQKGENHE